jgi:DNA-directed RNA polymerase alpha subunit
MPVQKVDFKIENVYDSANNISERLFIDIWTNGSISPNEALEICKSELLLTYLHY